MHKFLLFTLLTLGLNAAQANVDQYKYIGTVELNDKLAENVTSVGYDDTHEQVIAIAFKDGSIQLNSKDEVVTVSLAEYQSIGLVDTIESITIIPAFTAKNAFVRAHLRNGKNFDFYPFLPLERKSYYSNMINTLNKTKFNKKTDNSIEIFVK